MSDENSDYMMTHWHTDWCPVCENAIMQANRDDEWCVSCGYSRKPESAPLDSERPDVDDAPEFDGAGLA